MVSAGPTNIAPTCAQQASTTANIAIDKRYNSPTLATSRPDVSLSPRIANVAAHASTRGEGRGEGRMHTPPARALTISNMPPTSITSRRHDADERPDIAHQFRLVGADPSRTAAAHLGGPPAPSFPRSVSGSGNPAATSRSPHGIDSRPAPRSAGAAPTEQFPEPVQAVGCNSGSVLHRVGRMRRNMLRDCALPHVATAARCTTERSKAAASSALV
jgi:hypothetical protein